MYVLISPSEHIIQERYSRRDVWTVAPQELVLHEGNEYNTVVHVCNISACTPLSLEVGARDELMVTPVVVEVQPCMTSTLEVRLVRPPLHAATWKSAIRVRAQLVIV